MAPIVPIVPIIVLLVRVLAAASAGSRPTRSDAKFASTPRTILWAVLGLAWLGYAVSAFVDAAALADGLRRGVAPRSEILGVGGELFVVGAGACALFLAWPILRRLARAGRPRLVYTLAHLTLLFPRTGETYAGATLLAGLALAHRGGVTKNERQWLRSRLAKEKRHLGTFAAAGAMLTMLDAREAQDAGKNAEADNLAQRARTLLGTITYLSARGVPRGVRKLAYELLALDDARRGHWGSLDIAPAKDRTALTAALAGWAGEWLTDAPRARKVERIRKRLRSPVLDRLFERPRLLKGPESPKEAWARARGYYAALASGKAVGPRALFNMLVSLDILLHPECPDTVLPEAIRTNEDLVAKVHDDVAAAVAEPLARAFVPIHAMRLYGPISARVHQRVEAALYEEMERALASLEERLRLGLRDDALTEWGHVSYVRSVYRRVEMNLGPDAVRQVWPRFAYVYCKLGVDLSEHFPRMRPLAHAVFKCLSGEAIRFEDGDNVDQQAHNMTVTSGVD